jgi:hypothetical protein
MITTKLKTILDIIQLFVNLVSEPKVRVISLYHNHRLIGFKDSVDYLF